MLDSADLSLTLSKAAFKEVMRGQQDRLTELADLCFEKKTPVILVFEGWDAAGKGTVIRRLTQRLDPRGFKVLPTRAPMAHERDKPWLWRFWMHIPRHGQIAIFDLSWYGRVLVERVEGLTAIPDWIRAYEEINAFERTLAADNTVIVKFFLHISKEEQLRRFVMLTQHPETAWQVTADDWEHHRRYDEYVRAVEDMLANTSTPDGGIWYVAPATNREYCHYFVFRTVIRALEAALGVDASPEPMLELFEVEAERERVARQEKKVAKQAEKQAEKAQDRANSKAAKAESKAAKAESKAAKTESKAAKAESKAAKAESEAAKAESEAVKSTGKPATKAKPVKPGKPTKAELKTQARAAKKPGKRAPEPVDSGDEATFGSAMTHSPVLGNGAEDDDDA